MLWRAFSDSLVESKSPPASRTVKRSSDCGKNQQHERLAVENRSREARNQPFPLMNSRDLSGKQLLV